MEKTTHTSNPAMDKAFVFIAQNREAEPEASNVDLKALRRRVDLHLVPIMFMCFVAQFLDKVLLNYAAVMSLNQDLGLRGNDFANANTFTYVALLVAEIPTGEDQLVRVPAIASSLTYMSQDWSSAKSLPPSGFRPMCSCGALQLLPWQEYTIITLSWSRGSFSVSSKLPLGHA